MKAGKKGVIGGINITPLTDIFLVLLIIMMLMPIIEMKELQLNIRPTTNAQPVDPKNPPKTFKMSVQPDKFLVLKAEVDAAGLVDALTKGAEAAPDGLVIEVSPDSRHEQLAQALSAAKQAKIGKVAVKRLSPPKEAAKAAPPKPAGKAK